MEREEIWKARVAAWKASGLNMSQFALGRDFSASGLRYWVNRLGAMPAATPITPANSVRMARVLRRSAAAEDRLLEAGPVELHIAGARIRVGPGFDRRTLVEVLDVLEERAGRGGGR